MTKLMNADENVPNEFYIFVNKLNPLTSHNFNLTGVFSSGAFGSLDMNPEFLSKYQKGSANYLPYEPCEMDSMALSPYFLNVINDYRVEYDAEIFRKRYYQFFPSRLSAIYAFGNIESCQAVNKKHGDSWSLNSVKRFRLLDNPLNRVVRVNMEHVSLLRHAYRVSALQDIDSLWRGYWSGFGNIVLELPTIGFQRKQCESGVIWEYLIEGCVQHLDHPHNNAIQ